MSFISAGGIYPFPDINSLNLSSTGTNFTFDGGTDVLAVIFHIPATGTLANIHYRVAVSSTPNLTLRTELRTVSTTTGLPSAAGTLYGSSTSITSANPTTGVKTSAVNCTGATAGDLAALVFDLSAFASGSIQLSNRFAGAPVAGNFPYQMTNTAGSDTLAAINFNVVAFEYSGDIYYPMEWACIVGTLSAPTVSNSGVTRKGNVINSAVPRRAVGMFVHGDLDGDCLLRLRKASDDSILATATLDKDIRGANANSRHDYFFDACATAAMSANTDYYALLEGNSATTSTINYISSIPEAAQLGQLSGGSICYGTSYNSGYTPDTTGRYAIGILYDGLGVSAVKTWNGVDIALIGTLNGA